MFSNIFMTQERQNFDHAEIEKKWQEQWEKEGLYRRYDRAEKEYILDMFPYPSGSGLHVGHPKGYIATDVIARMKMLQGKSVLHPMGWDAFGLPAENYAIKNKVHPAKAVEENIKVFKEQLGKIGFTYDWDREVNTTDPAYYRWTQWIFLKLFEHGLAYEADEPINWCPSCKTGLANEDLDDGKCERCGSVIEQKKMRQWKLRMTRYADRLLEDLDPPAGADMLDWEESIKIQQRNWIGRSEGMLFSARVKDSDIVIQTFNSHFEPFTADTFVVIAPDHPLLPQLLEGVGNKEQIFEFCQTLIQKRQEGGYAIGEMEGMFTGRYIVDPVGNGELPIWVSSYALAQYGTGMVKCSAHDERDFAFAKKYGICLKPVLFPSDPVERKKVEDLDYCYTDTLHGVLTEPREFSGRVADECHAEIIEYLEKNKLAQKKVNYKMRDWVFSRQRYWGEPIPMIRCDDCKKKKYRYILIHGISGSGTGVYQAWLKAELELAGHTVFSPDLPNASAPNIDEQVEYILSNIEITPDTILVGHSLGGIVMMKLLEKISTLVRRSIFVDPVVTAIFNDHARPHVEKSTDWKFEYEKIKTNAGEVVILADAMHPIIRAEDIDHLRQMLGASQTITVVPEADHFCNIQEPEIWRAIEGIGTVALNEKDLPLTLPMVERYEPTGTGESPLAGIAEWVNIPCPRCGASAKRETNTMPQWAGSSWYYLAYIMRGISNFQFPISKYADEFKKWMPVDLYVGGAEHATRHLLYARFWHKFLFDIGAVSTIEPFKRLVNVGLILAEDGRKMSKRWNNVINPDDVIRQYGADSLRLYEMFMGPFTQSIAWSTDGVRGMRRFLDRVWNLGTRHCEPQRNNPENGSGSPRPKGLAMTNDIDRLLHQTIKKVTDDINGFRFNTAVSQLMILLNALEATPSISMIQYSSFLILLAPFAPHITEELWHQMGKPESIFLAQWPSFDAALAKSDSISFVIQINGKVRDRFELPVGLTQEEVEKIAYERDAVKKWMEGKEPKKKVFVQDKILNVVL